MSKKEVTVQEAEPEVSAPEPEPAPEPEGKVEGPKQGMDKILALLKAHPEVLESPGVAKALEKAELAEADKKMQPLLDDIKAVLDKAIASGRLATEDMEKARFINVEVVETDQGKEFAVSLKSRATRGSRKGSGAGVTGVTQQTWRDKNFRAFMIGSELYNKPREAIRAAGGNFRVKADGSPVSENYWRVILYDEYVALPIRVLTWVGAEFTLEEWRKELAS
jgi:hypothetical protein